MGFDERYKTVSDHFFSIVVLKYDIEYFYSADPEIQNTVFSKFPLVRRIRNMTFRNIILALYIAVKESEKYSFISLLKIIKKKFHREGRETELIEALINDIKTIENGERFRTISNFRNKHFAHMAMDRGEYETSITYGEIVKFVDELQEIYSRINGIVKKTHIRFDLLKDTKGYNLYRQLLYSVKLWDLIEEKVSEDENILKLNELLNIVK